MRLFAHYPYRVVLASATIFTLGSASGNAAPQQAQAQVENQDAVRADIGSFDAFLDAHSDIDAQLRANPSLLNNAEYLEAHPQLQAFLNQHPRIADEVKENPNYLMRRQNRFDARESGRRTGNQDRDRDVTRQEASTMDQFLDKYPRIDQDLRANPALVNNSDYLQSHPQLQAFLNQHPGIKTEITENPRYFMQRENRFDAQEPGRASRNPNPDMTNQQVATMDQFLDKHPNIDKQLRANPALINNSEYLEAHPELQAFLTQHPSMKEEITENPRYFMQRENRYDAAEPPRGTTADRDRETNSSRTRDLDRDRDADRDRTADRDADRDRTRDADRDRDADRSRAAGNPNPDLTNQELVSMDQFLDRHPDVAKSLEKKPDLINDRNYLKRHKDLDEYLAEHPAVREELRENPSYFMHRENQLEARSSERGTLRTNDRDRDRDRNTSDVDRDRNTVGVDRDRTATGVDRDLDKKEIQEMDRFLDKHKSIEKDLEKNPSLVNDRDYLKKHKSLDSFLRKNPRVEAEVKENPSAFMEKQQRLERRNHEMNGQPAQKHKTKIDEKEQTHTPTPH